MTPDPKGIVWDDEQPQGVQWDDEPPKPAETKWHEDLTAGIASGASRIAAGVLKPFVPEQDWQQMEQQGGPLSQRGRQQLSQMADTPLGMTGSIGMDVASVAALPVGAVAKVAERVPVLAKAMQARGLLPATARTADAAATQAGIGAAVSPDDRLAGAGYGAVGGTAGHMLSKATQLVKPTAEAQALLNSGVQLTPGQAGGIGSKSNWVEQAATSNPIGAMLIAPARQRAMQDMNRAVINQSIEGITGHPVAKSLAPRDAYFQAHDLVSKQYDTWLPYIASSQDRVMSEVSAKLKEATQFESLVPQSQWEAANRYVRGRLQDMTQNGPVLPGAHLKQLDSEVGAHARGLAKSADPLQRASAEAWFTVQDGIREAMAKGAQGDAAAKIQAANEAYKQLVPIRKALGNNDMMTPRALRKAMEHTAHPSKGLVEAANKVLPNTVPDSGTATRLMANLLPSALLAGGAGAQNLGWDTVGTGMLAAGALGSRPGAKLLTGQYGWQPASAETIRRITPAIARALRGQPQDDEQ